MDRNYDLHMILREDYTYILPREVKPFIIERTIDAKLDVGVSLSSTVLLS